MTDDTIRLEEDVTTVSPDAEAVKAFLAEAEDTEEAIKDPVPATSEQVAASEEDEVSAPQIKEVDVTDNAFVTTVAADKTFDKIEAEELTRMYMAPIKDSEIPITDEDQALYLKAMLNDTPLTLTQTLANDQVAVTCRALSVYEQDLVLEAAIQAVGGQETGIMSLLPSVAQQLRAAMQITHVNGVNQNAIYLEPARGDAHDEQVMDLIKQSDKKIGKMSAVKFGFLVRALNVFEHKMAKMHSLAYNKTFWKPVEID